MTERSARGDNATRGAQTAGKPLPNRAFQGLLDAVPGAWFLTRQDATLAYVNVGACQGLGYTREELLRCTIFDVDPTMTPELWSGLWATTAFGDSRTIRVRHRRKDGSDFPVEVRAARIVLDSEDLAISYTVDLTASEQTELINRRLLAAIEQASDAVVMTDALGNVEYVNPAYEQITAMSAAEVRGKQWSTLEIQDDSELRSALDGVLDGSTAAWKGRVQSRNQAGRSRDEEVRLSPIRDDQKQIVGCVAVRRDITEQLRIEQQMHRTQKVEAVGQLAGGIAHDFNNLLQVMQGQTHRIARGLPSGPVQPMLGELNRAIGRAASLVRQLLAFSRTGTVEHTVLRLDTLVSALHEMLLRLLGADVELEWSCSGAPVWVRGNAPQLEQVIVNLCINARDAMPNGGRLTLSLERAGTDGLPSAAPRSLAAGCAVLAVTDAGEGMSAEVRARLFEPFFTTKPPGRGTGLGLATVHAIVQDHGGCIDVSTRLGAGSTFRVFLPLAEPGVAQPVLGRASARIEGRGRVALVVEDERAVRELTVGSMKSAGFSVLSACDGLEAESLFAELRPDIAVLDVVMPRRGGQALHALMRERGISCPVVFVTGYDFESLAPMVDQEQVAILQKPFSEEELLAHVAQVLGERRTTGR